MTATLRACPCGELVEEVRRPGGVAVFRLAIPSTSWATAGIRTVTQAYPSASWLRQSDGRPHRHRAVA